MAQIHYKNAMKFYIWQLLELIDSGKSITKEEADDWAYNGTIYDELYNNFADDLNLFKMVNTYDYKKLDNLIMNKYSDKNIEPFTNGLIGLVNVCQNLLADSLIDWVDDTCEDIV